MAKAQQQKKDSREDTVNLYLQALTDPSTLVDSDEVDRLTEQLSETDTPVDRLRLQSQLEAAQNPDPSHLEGDFVAVAKEWADDNGISAESFASFGVPKRVLKDAGFTVSGGKSDGQRVSRETVAKAMVNAGRFTLPQIASDTGASRQTVRNVLNDLVEHGEAWDTGDVAESGGAGRKATVYAVNAAADNATS